MLSPRHNHCLADSADRRSDAGSTRSTRSSGRLVAVDTPTTPTMMDPNFSHGNSGVTGTLGGSGGYGSEDSDDDGGTPQLSSPPRASMIEDHGGVETRSARCRRRLAEEGEMAGRGGEDSRSGGGVSLAAEAAVAAAVEGPLELVSEEEYAEVKPAVCCFEGVVRRDCCVEKAVGGGYCFVFV